MIRGVIERRILLNYRVEAEVAAGLLPTPFRPKLVGGVAIAGICLIRLARLRPAFVRLPIGVGSENAALRFAVEWDGHCGRRDGVFIARRDTSSRVNALLGGRLFPGEHHHARFDVRESDDRYRVRLHSDDGSNRVDVAGHVSDRWPDASAFADVAEASRFFAGGSLGYSVTRDASRFDGLELRCATWAVRPLAIESAASSYFDDRARFPVGTATLDCALLMCGVPHEWHAREDVCCARQTTQPKT